MLVIGPSLSKLVGTINYEGVEVPYVMFIFPGIIVVTTLLSAMTSGASLYVDKRNGMIYEIVISPAVSLRLYVLSKIISSSVMSLVQLLILSLLIYAVEPKFFNAIFVLEVLALGFVSSSTALATVINNEEVFSGVFSIIVTLLTYISTVLYPLEAMPKDLRPFAMFSPVTIMTELTRRIVLNVALNFSLMQYVIAYIFYVIAFM